ncbi:MFS transporter [Paraburkholderia sp. 22B1P]|uniref:MFS transporter n=1 Tax=Paraburkholderia sp. 22B1P TaxID=3080498 RepID=UPI00308C1EC6|nr:MFS transporter [Paraburkholderia sp. 22B1P]
MKIADKVSRLFFNKNLWHFQVGFLFLDLGARCSQVAIAWWALRVTHSASVFATMMAAATCAELLARLLPGSLADRYNKIKVVIACNAVAATTCALLTCMAYTQHYESISVSVLMATTSAAIGVRDPIQSSIIPMLVDPQEVSTAFGTKGMLYSFALLIGPLIASTLLSVVGEANTLLADFLSIVIGSLLVATVLRTPLQIGQPVTGVRTGASGTFLRSFARLSMLRKVKAELYLSMFAMCANFSLFPFFFVLMPFYVQRQTHRPAWVLGVLDAAFAVGIFVGSGWFVKAANSWLRRDHTVAFGFGLMAANMLTVLAFRSYPALFLAFFAGGLGLMLINVNTSTVRALATPSSHLNQMTSIVSFLSTAINPIGTFAAGALLATIGFNATLAVLALISVASGMTIPFVAEVRRFMRMSNEALTGAYGATYPDAFR